MLTKGYPNICVTWAEVDVIPENRRIISLQVRNSRLLPPFFCMDVRPLSVLVRKADKSKVRS